MTLVRISLFGKFVLQAGERQILAFESRKVDELFCYLLLYREKPHPRETLADLLWGETTTSQSKNYLRKAIWQLQTALEELLCSEDERLILADGDWVQINPEFNLRLDVSELEKAFHDSRGILGRDLDDHAIRAIQEALAFYRGDLLEGWFPDWCLYERERLQHVYLALLDKLMDYCEAHGQYENGLAYGEVILRYDRARERTHRRLMRLFCLAGERTLALRQYEKCARALQEELAVQPSSRTRLLFERIRADEIGFADAHPTDLSPKAQASPDPLLALFDRLTIFNDTLRKIQAELSYDLKSLRETLRGRR
jgi:DNA-binding SARP family transcriptional activator